MTLYRQLLILIGVLIVTLFSGTILVKLHTTRTFLENQLESHAQDTATSLGLSIASYLGANDIATVDTMMNAIFDRGYYQKIELLDVHGKTIVLKEQKIVIEGVPTWFLTRLKLEIPEARVLASSGWKQMGALIVTSHPGFAYQSLWRVVVDITRIYCIAAFVAALVIIPILRILFRPLRIVQEQASALSRKEYTIQKVLPATRELRSVVTAMNSMVAKVRSMFEEQAQMVDRLGKSVFQDALTGLPNRRYFEQQLKASFSQDYPHKIGVVLLVEVLDLISFNQKNGYKAGDHLLKNVGHIVSIVSSRFINATAARISGGTFVVIIPGSGEIEAEVAAKEISKAFTKLASDETGHMQNIGHIGGICYEAEKEISELLADADRVLRASQLMGVNCWKVEMAEVRAATSYPVGEQMWKKLLDRTIESSSLLFYGQKVFGCDRQTAPLHLEILARINDKETGILGADVFVPQAERLKYISSLDKMLVTGALGFDQTLTGGFQLAIHLSSSSLYDATFVDWLVVELERRDCNFPAVIFEFSEFSAIGNLDRLMIFKDRITPLGGGVAVDNFGKNYSNFGYLNSLLPKYVKIDRSFTSEVEEKNHDSLFFLQALTGAAHSLDIQIIAKGVESVQQMEVLCSLNIDGVQGNFLDKPYEIKIAG